MRNSPKKREPYLHIAITLGGDGEDNGLIDLAAFFKHTTEGFVKELHDKRAAQKRLRAMINDVLRSALECELVEPDAGTVEDVTFILSRVSQMSNDQLNAFVRFMEAEP